MGIAKNLQIEQGEYGFSVQDAGAVCARCVGEPDLAAFVTARLSIDCCDFCGREEAGIAADAEDVLKHIGSSLQLEFEDAVGVLPHDAESPTGYFGDTFLIDEAIEHVGAEIEDPQFAAFVQAAFSDAHLCERDPFGVPRHEALTDIWTAFRLVVGASDTFDPAAPLRSLSDLDDDRTVAAGEVLANIAALVEEVGLVRRLDAGTTLYRGRRPHDPGISYTRAAQLGTPPAGMAGDGRMNRVGVSLFYGTEELDTAFEELVDRAIDSGKVVTIGEFCTTEPSWVIDLSQLPEYPGIFDEARQHQRQSILFLRGFRDDISEPARSSQTPNPAYRPTQAIAEHLLTHSHAPDGSAFRGIIYPSARRTYGENVVLDVVHEDCTDPATGAIPGRLQLQLTGAPDRHPI